MAVIGNAAQAEVINLDLFRKGWADIQVWLEPLRRNTAAAVGLAAMLLPRETDTEIMAVFPADHYIGNQTDLFKALDQGTELAQAGYLVTFGITPTRPDTGCGYIKADKAVADAGRGFHCAAFIEKPELSRAQVFLRDGGYYRHSGIFLFRREAILAALAQHLPDLYHEFNLVGEGKQSVEEAYQKIPSISLDHGIMEKAGNVVVVPVELEEHPTVERPWGRYQVVDTGPGFQVKQVEVDPGKRLSLQLHEHRAEHWVVVEGQALVTIGNETREVAANESVFVPVKTLHRLENRGTEPLRIIEVQTGSYLGEDDIVRVADDFWRVSEKV
jgi:mannose-6-phosphate isomerase-like protein (cupin superfamily)